MAYLLFADDQPAAIRAVAAHLARQGHRTCVVTGGEDALTRVREEPPDILMTDVMMPYRDGFEVLREVRLLYPNKDIPAIVLMTLGADGLPPRDLPGQPVSYVLRQPNPGRLAAAILSAVEELLQPQRLVL